MDEGWTLLLPAIRFQPDLHTPIDFAPFNAADLPFVLTTPAEERSRDLLPGQHVFGVHERIYSATRAWRRFHGT